MPGLTELGSENSGAGNISIWLLQLTAIKTAKL